MAGIIYLSGKVRVYENLKALCDFAGEPLSWCDQLWQELLCDKQLYEEFVFYMENGSILDRMSFQGYSLIDLYVWQMDKYNLLHDTGKNTAECKKTDMVLRAFYAMAELKKDPESYVKRLNEGRGMDRGDYF